MSTHRVTMRLAFQALFQLDAHNGHGLENIRAGLRTEHPEINDEGLAEAMDMALAAWNARSAADKTTADLAPTWPAHRQAAVDRAILRLAHYEMTAGPSKDRPKMVINDAVELAKEFSTDKSPGFVNALLDKVLKRTQGATTPPASSDAAAAQTDPGTK